MAGGGARERFEPRSFSNRRAPRARHGAHAAPCSSTAFPASALGRLSHPRNRSPFSSGIDASTNAAGAFDCISADQLLRACRRPPRPSRGSKARMAAGGAPLAAATTPELAAADAGAAPRGSLRLYQAASPAAELAAIADWAQMNLRRRAALSRLDLRSGSERCAARRWWMPSMPHWRRSASRCPTARARRALCSGRRHAARRLCAGACGLGLCWRPARDRFRSSDSAPCCARPNCKPRRRRPSAAARLGRGAAHAGRRARPTSRSGSRSPMRVARCPADRAGRPPCSGCKAPRERSMQLRGNHPISRWVSLWITAFEAGPWALRHRWSSSEYQAAERFRELLAALASGDRVVRHSLAPVRAANPAARRARHGVSGADRRSPDLGERAIASTHGCPTMGCGSAGCSEERWPPPLDPIPLLPVQLQRQYGVIAAARAVAIAIRRGLAESLAGSRPRVRLQLRRCRRRPPRSAEPAAAAGGDPLPPEYAGRTAASLARALRARPRHSRQFVDETAPPFGSGRADPRRVDAQSAVALRISRICAKPG